MAESAWASMPLKRSASSARRSGPSFKKSPRGKKRSRHEGRVRSTNKTPFFLSCSALSGGFVRASGPVHDAAQGLGGGTEDMGAASLVAGAFRARPPQAGFVNQKAVCDTMIGLSPLARRLGAGGGHP